MANEPIDALDSEIAVLDGPSVEAAIEAYVRVYEEHRAVSNLLDEIAKRKDALKDAAIAAMSTANMASVKRSDGSSISIRTEVSFSGTKDHMLDALAWVPVTLHTINAQTFGAYIKECLARGVLHDGTPVSEKTLPDWIAKYERRTLSVRGLRSKTKGADSE